MATDEMTKNKQKIARLEMELARAKLQIKASEKANDTRRKVLLGAYLLEVIEDPKSLKISDTSFDSWLVRDKDRALFGLLPTTD